MRDSGKGPCLEEEDGVNTSGSVLEKAACIKEEMSGGHSAYNKGTLALEKSGQEERNPQWSEMTPIRRDGTISKPTFTTASIACPGCGQAMDGYARQ